MVLIVYVFSTTPSFLTYFLLSIFDFSSQIKSSIPQPLATPKKILFPALYQALPHLRQVLRYHLSPEHRTRVSKLSLMRLQPAIHQSISLQQHRIKVNCLEPTEEQALRAKDGYA
jgi:hypothetical protein